LHRRIKRNVTIKSDGKEYESEAYYKIKPLNDENLNRALELEIYANTEYYLKEYSR